MAWIWHDTRGYRPLVLRLGPWAGIGGTIGLSVAAVRVTGFLASAPGSAGAWKITWAVFYFGSVMTIGAAIAAALGFLWWFTRQAGPKWPSVLWCLAKWAFSRPLLRARPPLP